MRTDTYIEHHGKQVNVDILRSAVLQTWESEGRTAREIEHMELYFKPEENICYYVINGIEQGHFVL